MGPKFSSPITAWLPKSYDSQNSATVQLAVGGKEGSKDFIGTKAEAMLRPVAKGVLGT